jgi:serine-type D-Ala-D-Ala carboxypeptidase (penicillin-binding protein 5/6)
MNDMRRFFLLAFLLIAAPAYAEPVETSAAQVYLIDAGTGAVLLAKREGERMPTSSMSKTMTMYMVFGALKEGRLHLDDELLVSEKSWRMEGSKMFIHVGDKVKVEDLVRGVLIQSGNDAAVALAEGISGSEEAFAAAMTAKAKELGMNDSNFVNASGWPADGHYSTAKDLAILAQRIIADFPDYYHYFSEREFTYNKIRQQNRDPLLGRLAGADGLKTGHTEIAGYGLIGSAQRDGRRLVLVMNGLQSQEARAQEGIRLMEWAFRNFENKEIVKAGEVVGAAKVWLGAVDEVPLAARESLTAVLPVASRSGVKIALEYNEPVKAPIARGAVIGKLKITVPDQPERFVDLVAGADVARAGLFARVKARLNYLVTGRS